MENTCSWYDPSCALQWLQDELQSLSVWLYDAIMSGIASIYEAIPAPDFLLNANTLSIPSGVSWVVSMFQLDVGVSIVVSAYIARFILRRIPVIG
jgi:hypothetical protein